MIINIVIDKLIDMVYNNIKLAIANVILIKFNKYKIKISN
jgi:hypothetical protein